MANPARVLRPKHLALGAGIAALALLPPSLATAAEHAFEFTGRGFGHGVGLSQYGARGAALAGWDERRIIAHYYRGTTIERRRLRGVRVLLRSTRGNLLLRGPFVARTGGRTVRIATGPVRVRADGGAIVLRGRSGRVLARSARPITVASSGGVRLGARRYRGRVRLDVPREGVVEAINIVGMEQYLRGVVPAEVPASWGDDTPAALRAQATAARTYALATRRARGRFDQFSDTRSQVYQGMIAEDRRTDDAVRATAGQVITFGGKPIVAYYFSTSGGRTAAASTVFPDVDEPYLVSVADPFDRVSPVHRWPEPTRVSGADLGDALGLDGPVALVRVTERGLSGRAKTVEVQGESGARIEVSGSRIRAAAGLRSTWFFVARR